MSLRQDLIKILEEGEKDKELLSRCYAFIGPYPSDVDRGLDKHDKKLLDEIRRALQIRFDFDDSE